MPTSPALNIAPKKAKTSDPKKNDVSESQFPEIPDSLLSTALF